MQLQKANIPFTMVANTVLCRDDLSLKAKGLYAYLFSKPDGWDFAADRIAKECREERKAIMAALKELETADLLQRQKRPDGKMQYALAFASQSTKRGLRDSEPKYQNGTVPKRHCAKTGLVSNTDEESKKEEENKTDGVAETAPTPKRKAEKFFRGIESLLQRKDDPEMVELLRAIADRNKVPKARIWDEVVKFGAFWTERNAVGTKERWQMQKTFEVDKRLVTWFGKVGFREFRIERGKGKGIVSVADIKS